MRKEHCTFYQEHATDEKSSTYHVSEHKNANKQNNTEEANIKKDSNQG
jgi:hypothetical protein